MSRSMGALSTSAVTFRPAKKFLPLWNAPGSNISLSNKAVRFPQGHGVSREQIGRQACERLHPCGCLDQAPGVPGYNQVSIRAGRSSRTGRAPKLEALHVSSLMIIGADNGAEPHLER
jgi:hypothetical protein